MQEYVGNELELGPSKPNGTWRIYTYIKIEGKILKKVAIKSNLDVILRDQFKREGPCKLWVISWLFRPLIVAITQDDGQTFRQSLTFLYGYSGACLLFMLFSLLHIDTVFGKFFLLLSFVCMLPSFLLIRKIRKVSADHSY
ncbi:hypothetical protein KTF21_19535 [Burkholderia multivorans]|uniref:hypothetical protein n=1 Tax=Burkholderia multivorans TaxID=87883 RepID=UPI001C217FD4|nr:hypothetical protein [Burkholderia multivorans]MBU9650874.1 hypothetical protein [Burkholderia multivorans]